MKPNSNDAVLGGAITLGAMPIAKAKEIVGAMLQCGFHDMGIEEDDVPRPPWPSQYSLEELCIAARMVSDDPGKKTASGLSKMMTALLGEQPKQWIEFEDDVCCTAFTAPKPAPTAAAKYAALERKGQLNLLHQV